MCMFVSVSVAVAVAVGVKMVVSMLLLYVHVMADRQLSRVELVAYGAPATMNSMMVGTCP